jgi:hypothetical protein
MATTKGRQIFDAFGFSAPGGRTTLNGLHINRGQFDEVHVTGDLWLNGLMQTPLRFAAGTSMGFDAGTVTVPGISFSTSTNTGFYMPSVGEIGFTTAGSSCAVMKSTGLEMATGKTISTLTGDLYLNPAGANIDFGGKTLTNYAGMSSNPLRYDVIAAGTGITTADATPSALFAIPTTTGSNMTLVTEVSCTNTTDNISTGGFTFSEKAKNLAGVVTISGPIYTGNSVDTGLSGIAVAHAVSGTNVIVQVTGLLATSIKWFGATKVTKQTF